MNSQHVSWEMLFSLVLFFGQTVAAASSSSSFPGLPASRTESVCPSATAYEFPIRNVSLGNNKLRRGAAASIGSPEQLLAFQLSNELNNTYIFDNVTLPNLGGCEFANQTEECYTQVGGFFNETASTSFSWASNSSALATAVENDPLINPKHDSDLWATDVLTMAPIKGVSGFPFGISRVAGEGMNTIGLGRNSTLLNALVNNGDIAARVWGYWQGWIGDYQYQKDGSLVLGGYDVKKTMGRNITLPTSTADSFNTNCFLATVTDIKMDLTNGSSLSLFGSAKGTARRACVLPKFASLSLSNDLWEEFLAISQSTYVKRAVNAFAFWSMLIEADGAYDGNLTISLDPGLDITIPNHQLITPEYAIDLDGEVYVRNDSVRDVLIGALQEVNANDMIVLGGPFFSSAYMMVDNDRGEFTLWKANPTTDADIVAVTPPGCIESTAAAATPSQAPFPSAMPTTTPPSQATVSKGTIIGAVAGGLAGIAVITGAFILFQQARNKKDTGKTDENEESSGSMSPILYKPELAANRHPPQELPLVRNTGYTLAPYEMSEERVHSELPGNARTAASMYEMPGATTPRRRNFELPALPSSPRPVRKDSLPAKHVS